MSVFLDNNGTTPINQAVKEEFIKWLDITANPSSSYKAAIQTKKMIQTNKEALLEHAFCSSNVKSANCYQVTYTSGASESNCFIIRACVAAYHQKCKIKPCVIISAIEHESIMSCCNDLAEHDMAEIIYIMPNYEGTVLVKSVESALSEHNNVALVSIMFANNEIGTINNVKEIGAIAHNHRVPLHVDAVQMFGKFQINIPSNNIDAMSVSFHKMGGPVAIGALFIRSELIENYGLCAMINGTQQGGLRGGTEAYPAIAASGVALKQAFMHRGDKNTKLLELRNLLINGFAKIYPIGSYERYLRRDMQSSIDTYTTIYDPSKLGFGDNKKVVQLEFEPVEIVVLGPQQNESVRFLPNTVLFSIVKNVHDRYGPFCNGKLKNDLERKGFIVSIGSACHTSNPERSHVLKAIECPDIVARGIIRVSIGDYNTRSDIVEFLKMLKVCCERQIVGKVILPKKKKDIKK